MTQLPVTSTASRSLVRAGQAANQAAARLAFDEYRANRPAQTLRAQQTDLANFAHFLDNVGINDAPSGDSLQSDPAVWQGITHGLVLAYREWLMAMGYAIATVNRRLATVKSYAQLALLGGGGELEGNERTINELEKIKAVHGFGHKHGRNRDAKRSENGTPTRVGPRSPTKRSASTWCKPKRSKRSPPRPRVAAMPCCSACFSITVYAVVRSPRWMSAILSARRNYDLLPPQSRQAPNPQTHQRYLARPARLDRQR